MRILIRTRPFYPSIGGLETVMQMLAEEFSKAGHVVTVVTASPNDQPDTFPFEVLRQPSLSRLLKAHREADVVIFGNISLWWFLTLCLCPRPWVATHHGWYYDTSRPVKWMDRLKVALTSLASANVSVSEAVNRFLGQPGIVIPNPFDHETFRLMPEVPRDRDLVFLGRLVSDKGADMLIEALALLKQKGLRPGLTMIGGGPELETLQKQASSLGVEDQIHFAGPRRGEELARTLNAHRIMVIPSRCSEGFGIVAIEGIACGCVPLAFPKGGLPEAVGECGLICNSVETEALADGIELLVRDSDLLLSFQGHAAKHLSRFHKKEFAQAYLSLIQSLVK